MERTYVLAVYGIIAFAMTYYFSRGYNDNKVSFLVARRELGTFQGIYQLPSHGMGDWFVYICTANICQRILWIILVLFRKLLTLGAFAYFKKDTRREVDGSHSQVI